MNILEIYKRLSIGKKFVVLFTPIVLLLVILGGSIYHSINKVNKAVTIVTEDELIGYMHAQDIQYIVVRVQQWYNNLCASSSNVGIKRIDNAVGEFKKVMSDYKNLNLDNPEKVKELENVEAEFASFLTKGDALVKLYRENGGELGENSMDDFIKISDDLRKNLAEKLKKNEQAELNISVQSLHKTFSTVKEFSVIAVLIGMALVILIYILINNSVIKRINATTESVAEIIRQILEGDGDLHRKIPMNKRNCSSMVNCNNPKCPEYGKEASCWDSVGSSALEIHCPSILSGKYKSCLECAVTKEAIYNEIDFLNYWINTLIGKFGYLIRNIKLSSNKVTNAAKLMSATTVDTDAGIQLITKAIATVAEEAGSQQKSINEIRDSLKAIIETINIISDGADKQVNFLDQTATTVKHTNISMNKLAEASHKEISEVENTKSIINEMANAINQVTADANNVAQGSMQTAETAKEGEAIVVKTVNGMEKIKETVLSAAQKIEELGKNSSLIGEIIEVIDDIAEQTNLLALNAAIEAARAGDHGRGFAVVADEVRKLAERSGKATKEIALLVKQIQSGTNVAVESMKVGTKEVQKGAELAQGAKKALNNVITAVQNTVTQIQNISAAAEEMSASSAQVVETVNGITGIVKSNSVAVEQVTKNSSEVVGAVGNIQEISQNNQRTSRNIKEKFEKINDKVDKIAEIAQDNSSTAEEVSASAEEITVSIEQVTASTIEMVKIADNLSKLVDRFKA
ncbi:MAG: hypothetical protein A2X41_07160 [Candidatus Margulisbacteria bacterium GWE2_39_32]|nr:MAG: hypothetical protein A2X41_07160 [Candidatus Margulisbacteria bacterium GWE2_39_32]